MLCLLFISNAQLLILGAKIQFYSVENRFAENIVLLKLPVAFSESWDKS
jgi:hypothetical protein